MYKKREVEHKTGDFFLPCQQYKRRNVSARIT